MLKLLSNCLVRIYTYSRTRVPLLGGLNLFRVGAGYGKHRDQNYTDNWFVYDKNELTTENYCPKTIFLRNWL